MRTTKTTYNLTVAQRFVHVLVFFVALLSLSLHNLNAQAATLTPDEYRTGKVVDKFDDTWQFAAAYKLRPPRRLRASYLDLSFSPTLLSGGLSRTNPGMDIVGLNFSYNLGAQ